MQDMINILKDVLKKYKSNDQEYDVLLEKINKVGEYKTFADIYIKE
jgi:hypothetical protein